MQALLRAEVLLTGFELELYAINELSAVYWYLAEVTNPAQFADYRGKNDSKLSNLGDEFD